jgi:hypothetical protein
MGAEMDHNGSFAHCLVAFAAVERIFFSGSFYNNVCLPILPEKRKPTNR